MRREAVIVMVLGLALSVVSCRAPAPAADVDCAQCVPDPPLNRDVVSGCDVVDGQGVVVGSPVVKALIQLKESDDKKKCVVDKVEPGLGLCVVQGGVIRWKVDSGCGDLVGDRDNPAIKITRLEHADTKDEAKWLEEACQARIKTLKGKPADNENLLLCDVPATAPLGRYKYSLGGKIEPLDPPIEVKPPRRP